MNEYNKKVMEDIEQLIGTIKIKDWQQKIEKILTEYSWDEKNSASINDMEFVRIINDLETKTMHILDKINAINYQRIQSDKYVYNNLLDCYNWINQKIVFEKSNYSDSYLYGIFCEKMFEKSKLQYMKNTIQGNVIEEKLPEEEFKIYQLIKKEAIMKKYINILCKAKNIVLLIENNPLENEKIQ